MWIYPHTVSGDHTIIAKVNGTMEKEYFFSVDDGGYIQFELERSANDGKAKTANAVVTTNSWQKVMVSYNASTNEVLIYYNEQSQTLASNINGTSTSLSDDLYIGMLGGSYSSKHFDGLIDDVKIYDYIASSDQTTVGDLNEDGIVDFNDFAELADDWLEVGL